MLLKQSLKHTLTQKVDPKIILANTILACSSMELVQAVEQELSDNPALERPDEDVCGACTLPRELCSHCPLKADAQRSDIQDDADWREWYAPAVELAGDLSGGEDSEFDPIANLCTQRTLADHLRDLLGAEVNAEKFALGDYIIGSINPAGYFEGSIDDLARDLHRNPEELHEVLAIIQTFDPPGVGARTLQECLLIQLRNLEEQGDGNPLAIRMVQVYWPDTASRRISRLAHHLKAPRRAVAAALDFIRDRLTPYPGESFRAPWDTNPDNLQSIQPDIVVRRTLAGYEIDVLMTEHQTLAINSKYREAYAGIRNGHADRYSEDERRHVVEYVERAETFIRSILQRRKTLRAITKYVVEYQQGYIETSQKAFLRPLTRTHVARSLEVHESTVSRATANKWVQLPSEEVVSFDLFFDGSVSIKDVIYDIISAEDKARPLSDQEIAGVLQERGLNVARRTIMKYREAQNILSSRRRRKAS